MRSLALLCVLAIVVPMRLQAADRLALTHLFPMGGQLGTTQEVTAHGQFPVWPVQVWSDTPAIQWKCLEEKGKLQATLAANAELGRHWIRLYHETSGAASAQAFYVDQVPQTIELEPNDRIHQANAIEDIPRNIYGILAKRGDTDLFCYTLKQGSQITAQVDAAEALRSPVDANVQVLDESGFVLAENLDSAGLDPKIVWTAPKDGSYRIRVFGFPANPDSAIGFSGGADWVYRLRLREQTSAPKESIPPGYSVRRIEHGQASQRSQPITLSLPARVNGAIQPQEHHYFQLDATANQWYQVDVIARGSGSSLDAKVSILDAQGKELAQQDDIETQRDPSLRWQAPAEAAYLIELTDFHSSGGDDFNYELQVHKLDPKIKLQMVEDVVQLSIGKELETTVQVEREGNNQDEASIAILDAPNGLEWSATKSIHGTDTEKKITLKLKASQPFQGPLRLVAQFSSGDKTSEEASTALGKPIWLSAVAE